MLVMTLREYGIIIYGLTVIMITVRIMAKINRIMLAAFCTCLCRRNRCFDKCKNNSKKERKKNKVFCFHNYKF